MGLLFLLAQAVLLILAGVMALRVREELQLLVRQAASQQQGEQIKRLHEELQQTLREVRTTLSEGIVQLEGRITRAEQVLRMLEAHLPDESAGPPSDSQDAARRVPVERILALADTGCDVKEIARLTGVAEGEVLLVLQLRAQRVDQSGNTFEEPSSGNFARRNEGTDE
ncbi:MAG: hypothetical protein KatS3mg022_0682 [Armatimonadota bacterium]|nr:MAG: hypothetical protein KatS3mg022_0682 [Armatimonadota bacterium]